MQVRRIALGAPLNSYERDAFYTQDEKGGWQGGLTGVRVHACTRVRTCACGWVGCPSHAGVAGLPSASWARAGRIGAATCSTLLITHPPHNWSSHVCTRLYCTALQVTSTTRCWRRRPRARPSWAWPDTCGGNTAITQLTSTQPPKLPQRHCDSRDNRHPSILAAPRGRLPRSWRTSTGPASARPSKH